MGIEATRFTGVGQVSSPLTGPPPVPNAREYGDLFLTISLEKTGERCDEPEVYRLKGALLLQLAVPSERQAATCLQQALAVARHQQAKSLELRAAMSLARLWQRQGKHTEAHALLAPIYGWCTEGFDTADLREAKALLEILA